MIIMVKQYDLWRKSIKIVVFDLLNSNKNLFFTISKIKEKMLHKKLGKVDIPINIEKLPHIEYFSLHGDEKQRIDFALYTHIP